MIKLSLMIIGD